MDMKNIDLPSEEALHEQLQAGLSAPNWLVGFLSNGAPEVEPEEVKSDAESSVSSNSYS